MSAARVYVVVMQHCCDMDAFAVVEQVGYDCATEAQRACCHVEFNVNLANSNFDDAALAETDGEDDASTTREINAGARDAVDTMRRMLEEAARPTWETSQAFVEQWNLAREAALSQDHGVRGKVEAISVRCKDPHS